MTRGKNASSRSGPSRGKPTMSSHDAEIEAFKQGVSCAVLLERASPAWKLDKAQSTKRALKYRRGEGEILIVNHEERGWFDPLSSAKGDVFSLVQHLNRGLNFGQVRQFLRPFVGVSPAYTEGLRASRPADKARSVVERWNRCQRLKPGCPAWNYLASQRRLPAEVPNAARNADAVRQGGYGNAWFAHRDEGDVASHIEIRGRDFKGSVSGGKKTLFRLAIGAGVRRLAVAEAPIDALSLARFEGIREDTTCVATGGGMGPSTIQAIQRELANIPHYPDAVLVSAADANRAGERYAERHAELAAAAGVKFERLLPPIGEDWNDVLKGRGYDR